MRVAAWMCDKCSRMSPGESEPAGWHRIVHAVVGERGSDTFIFCSVRCVSRNFHATKEATGEEVETDATAGDSYELHYDPAEYTCQLCDWLPGASRGGGPIKRPEIALRMHMRRAHGETTH